MLLCEFILNSTRAPPGEEFLYHTLLELHLMGHEDTQPPDASATPATPGTGATDPSTHAKASTNQQSASAADLQQAEQV